MKRAALFVLVACGSPQPASQPIASHPSTAPELVTIETGTIRGDRAGATLAWKGIPYAKPPIGPLRWRAPEPAAPWSGVRDATGFGSACVQAGTSTEPGGTAMGSEDCLTLNVWAPAHDRPLPVMVFVHGGYFTWGSSSYRRYGTDLYDGAKLAAAAGVVVVTLNYRVGPFGFLAHPGLADEDPHHASGNYGLLDQLAALAWVHKNVATFGGDPSRVTLFGQSAGAISTAALVASPLARGLFARAILHSGNGDALPLARAEAGGLQLARTLGCTTVACMRDKTASAIATAMPESFDRGYKYGPIVDGWVLPRKPIEIVERGEHNHVPLIVATTSNEFSTMVQNYVDGPLVTAADYTALLARRFGGKLAARLAEHYPASAYPTPLAAYTAVWSDAAFTCGSDWLADAAAAHQREPVYRFVYDHTYATGPLAKLGAGHGLDLYLVFGNTPARYLELDGTDRALSAAIVGYWSRFAERGDPNGPAAPFWPARGERHDELAVDSAARVRTPPADRCDFWLPILHDRR